MINNDFYAAWPEYFDVIADISWSIPINYEHIFNAPENKTAYFYTIVSKVNETWEIYYIGMTYNQSAAVRVQQLDHRRRLNNLQSMYPRQVFSLSLGTPKFMRGRITKKLIEVIEGLLIYGNWHEKMINSKKIQLFKDLKQIYINNIGWTEHIETEVAHGVFSRNSRLN